jgi:hypothetical protein
MPVPRWLKSHISIGKKMYSGIRDNVGKGYNFVKKVQSFANKGMDLLHSLKHKALQAGIPDSAVELLLDNPLVNGADSLVQYGNAIMNDFDRYVVPNVNFADRVISTGLNVGDELFNSDNPSPRIDIKPLPKNEMRGNNVNGQVDRSNSNQFRSSMAAI